MLNLLLIISCFAHSSQHFRILSCSWLYFSLLQSVSNIGSHKKQMLTKCDIVYFASFLATLNCRDMLRAKASAPVTLMLPLNTTMTAVGLGMGVVPATLSRRYDDSLAPTPRLRSTRSSPRLRRVYSENGSPRMFDGVMLSRMGSSRSIVRLDDFGLTVKGDDKLKVRIDYLICSRCHSDLLIFTRPSSLLSAHLCTS